MNERPAQESQFYRFLPVLVLVVATALLWNFRSATLGARELSYTEFTTEIQAGKIAEVRISPTEMIGKLKADVDPARTERRVSTKRLPNVEDRPLIEAMAEKGVAIVGVPETTGFWNFLAVWLIPILFLVLIMNAARARGAGPLFSIGKTQARIYDEYRKSTVTFQDVAGVDEAEAELVEVVNFLKTPQKYTRLGGRIPKGVLLVGPPGTGKTLLAKAVAGEANVPFLTISGAEFMEVFVGVGAARVRDLFAQAKQRAPCIIFIDELDAIGKTRSVARGPIPGNEEREQTLNQLLSEMDGFDSSTGVIIMAATNTPEVLDPALLRAGRFDRQVVVDRPDVSGRLDILKVHAARTTLASEVDLDVIAARTPGMVGADLANIVNEAALLAARRDASGVGMRDFEEAIDRVTLGLQKKRRVMSPKEKERIAYHEAGHALAALSLEHANPVHRVSIIPRSIGALGHTLQLPTEEHFLITRPEIEDQIAVLMAGQCAESLIFAGETSTGSADDLAKASEMARQMVTRFGMSAKLGSGTYGRPLGFRYIGLPAAEDRDYSERVAQEIDDEIRHILDTCRERAAGILSSRRSALTRVATELIEHETLDRDRLIELILPRVQDAEAVASR